MCRGLTVPRSPFYVLNVCEKREVLFLYCTFMHIQQDPQSVLCALLLLLGPIVPFGAQIGPFLDFECLRESNGFVFVFYIHTHTARA